MKENVEQKVIRVFTDGNTNLVKAVLYREEDSICRTTGYVLQFVGSGEKVYHSDPEELSRYCMAS